MDRVSQTWSLMGASWQVLKKDKEIMVFAGLSVISSMLVIASFILPSITAGYNWRPPRPNAPAEEQIIYYCLLFAFYFCNYLVTIYFNVAIVACASLRMKGGDPTVLYGLSFAAGRFSSIFGWAFLSATIGVILKAIQDRSKLLGRITAGILGVTWSLASFLVIPILVNEEIGAMAALHESSALIRKTWGEQLVGNFSFGMIFFLLTLPVIIVIAYALKFGSGFSMIFTIVLCVEYLIVLSLLQSVLKAIFQAAVYRFLREGEVPHGFTSDLLENSVRRG
jgi:hypothetical protein